MPSCTTQSVGKDLQILEKMIHAAQISPNQAGIHSAMTILLAEEFPQSSYLEHGDINQLISQLLDPWLKASGEIQDEHGHALPFPEEELPQPTSPQWRLRFINDLKKLRALIQLTSRN